MTGDDTFHDFLAATDVDPPAESLVTSFDDDVGTAMRSAMWHTIIDGAATEAFVDSFDVRHLRDALHRLGQNGYASTGLSKTDLYGDEVDGQPDGAAFFAGDTAADRCDDAAAYDNADAADPFLPAIDGYLVERVDAVPSNCIVLVDVAAVGRVPVDTRTVFVGMDRTPSVTSPIVVTDPDGIAVVNIAE
jgi:hypothetical protein